MIRDAPAARFKRQSPPSPPRAPCAPCAPCAPRASRLERLASRLAPRALRASRLLLDGLRLFCWRERSTPASCEHRDRFKHETKWHERGGADLALDPAREGN